MGYHAFQRLQYRAAASTKAHRSHRDPSLRSGFQKSVTPGTWHEVRVSRINGAFSLEVDGIEYPLSDQPIPNPLGQCGCQEAVLAGNGSAVFDNPPDAHDGFNGMLDDIRINGVGKPPKASLLFWHLDEGSGTTATDIHGNILTLTPDPTTGDPAWVPGQGK